MTVMAASTAEASSLPSIMCHGDQRVSVLARRSLSACAKQGSRTLTASSTRATRSQGLAERSFNRAAGLDVFVPPRDPIVDTLARESRNSVFLLKQLGAADPRRDGEWREWLARRAAEVDPDNPDVIYEVGSLLQRTGRSREALTFFTRHLDMVKDDQQTLVQMGKCYSDLNELDQAEGTLRRALALGDDAVGYYNLGFVMEQRRN